jgi:gluconolactonase
MAIFVDGLGAPECPRLTPQQDWLLVEMAPDLGCVTRLSRDGASIERLWKTGRPNGCVMDIHGSTWVAESFPEPALLAIDGSGRARTVLRQVDGAPLLFPNDLCFGPDAHLYFTDSGIHYDEWVIDGEVRGDWETAAIDGRVIRLDPKSLEAQVLDSGIAFANGIAFGPDDKLYVNEMNSGNIYAYDVSNGSARPPSQRPVRRLFGNVVDRTRTYSGYRGPDGMAFSAEGRLYCAVYGQRDVTVLDSSGRATARIETQGRFPTNVSFGPEGEKRLYVTEIELGRMEAFDVAESGMAIYYGQKK